MSEEAPPTPPPEVVALQERIAAQGLAVRDLKQKLKAGEATQEEVDAGVQELLSLKKELPAEFQEKKKPKEKKKPGAPDPRKAAKEARMRAKEEEMKAAKAAKAAKEAADTEVGVLTETYGDLPMVQSREEDKQGRTWTRVGELTPELAEQTVLIRGHVHTTRVQPRLAFVVVRQSFATVQCVVSNASMVKWCNGLSNESVVDVYGKLVPTKEPTNSTQSSVEVQVDKLFVVTRAASVLPFQVTACDRTVAEAEELAKKVAEEGAGASVVTVGQDLKLTHRHLSLRTPFQAAVMRISSGICHYFREFLNSQGFVEIQTPKLLGGASEGGAEVFMTDYFGSPACLAQSPQLHKQISAACSGLERVFEIGPVFRAENSNTNRHLCEFHGLDMEMAFNEHYHEVLAMFSDLFFHIFDSLNANYAKEIALIREYHEAEPLVYRPSAELKGIRTVGNKSNTLLLEWKEAMALLREDGITEAEQGDLDDMDTVTEKRLGALVKAKYGVDWFMLDKFPSNFRPFYTMPDPTDPNYSNSYDFFIRGQEIMSGAQRVHDADLLTQGVAKKGIPPETLAFYIDAFKHGALPHGGGGIGLERVVMLFLGIPNIRQACFFVRDPQRLTP